jgi:CRISPR system Cascade subunit CasA
MTISFNLLDEPWIPYVDLNGVGKIAGLRECLKEAHKIKAIAHSNPLIEISIYRLLLAILHRNFGPSSKNEWKRLYDLEKWDYSIISLYFNKWNKKFDLFGENDDRFYQIQSDIVGDKKKTTSISKIDHTYASGNNASLFDHSWDHMEKKLSFAQVARLLIAYQNYALGGGVSKPYNYSHGPLVTGFVSFLKGKNLFDTLMLNMVIYNESSPFDQEISEDKPFWERSLDEKKDLDEDKSGRYPIGYLDYLTFQSRRIWLIPEEKNGEFYISHFYQRQGEKIIIDWDLAPFKVYSKREKGEFKGKYLPINLQANKQVWRDLDTLISLNDKQDRYLSPFVLKNISSLIERDIIPYSSRYNIELYGIIRDPKKAAKIISFHHSCIPLPLILLKTEFNKQYINTIKLYIEKIEKILKVLSEYVFNSSKEYLFPNTEGIPNKNQKEQIEKIIANSQIKIKYYGSLEIPFTQFLDDLSKIDILNPTERKDLVISFIKKYSISKVEQIQSEFEMSLQQNIRALKPAIKLKGLFKYKLKSLISKDEN